MARSTIRIDRVATRGGDGGLTSLGDGTRVGKHVPRVEAMGAVDEANAAIGQLRLHCLLPLLETIQRDLFDVGADLCMPQGEAFRLDAAGLGRLDASLATLNAGLRPLTSFVLPAGNPAVVAAHLARVTVRRAERRCVELHEAETLNAHVLAYLNRLSDWLFVLARSLAEDEAMWRDSAGR